MNICVFCASSNDVNDAFKADARQLGNFIAQGGHTLVYGGATGGLMDAVAEGAHECGGEIIGVVPELIVDKGRKSDLPTQMFVVSDMSERKELMKEYADIIVVLPGGIGTYDELFDALASGMVGYHDKQVILVNTDNFYEGLLLQFKRMTQEHVGYTQRTSLHVCASMTETIEYIKNANIES